METDGQDNDTCNERLHGHTRVIITYHKEFAEEEQFD